MYLPITAVNYLPLPPPGTTPVAGVDHRGIGLGRRSGHPGRYRTMALLGVHACVAVTAVTVQNTLGVKSFHEVPDDVVAGQIEAVVTISESSPPRPGCWHRRRSSARWRLPGAGWN